MIRFTGGGADRLFMLHPTLPEYCCVILRDATGQFWFEVRPATARLAAGLLTCFGGARHPEELPEDCLRRELREELGLDLGPVRYALALVSGDRLIAWFYESLTLLESLPSHREFGYSVTRLTPSQLAAALRPASADSPSRSSATEVRISPWHAAALRGWQAGQSRVEVDSD